MKKILSYVAPTLDVRSLALFRIVLGIVLIADLFLFRINFLNIFYSNEGIFNLELSRLIASTGDYNSLNPYSLMFYIKNENGVRLFFLLALISYILYTIGFHSRKLGAISLFFLWNIQHRASIITETDDRIMIVILFWGIFLPLDNHFSVVKKSEQVSLIPSWAILCQIGLIYFINGISKTGISWQNGQALSYALHDTLWVNKSNADFLLKFKSFCEIITHLVRPFEIILGLILIYPFKLPSYTRSVVLILILVFHWGINIFISLGLFPLIYTSIACLLIPSRFWEKIQIKSFVYQSNTVYLNGFSIFFIFIFAIQSYKSNFLNIHESSFLKNSLTIQKWSLYSPDVNSYTGWYRLKGITTNDNEIDLFTNKVWRDNEIAFKNYQYGCWQNLIQYLVFKQPYYQQIEEELVNYYCKFRNDEIRLLELIHFRKIIQNSDYVIEAESQSAKLCM